MTQKEYSIQWGGRELTLSTGSLAKQATASVEARYGDTVVLATVVLGGIRAGIDFFPLMVDFGGAPVRRRKNKIFALY